MPPLEDQLIIVGDSNRPRSEREALWDAVIDEILPIIKEKVGIIAPSFIRSWGYKYEMDDLINETLIHLRKQTLNGKFDGGSFPKWCYKVTLNKIREINRKILSARRNKQVFQEHLQWTSNLKPEPWANNFDVENILDYIEAELRHEMDRFVLWYNLEGDHAPSMLWLRLRIAVNQLAEHSVPEKSVPWRENEQEWCFRPTWPPIRELWALLSNKKINSSKKIVTAINPILDEAITAGDWNTLFSRAYQKFKQCQEPLSVMQCLLSYQLKGSKKSPSDE